eukprot:CAMPEP_0172743324 /NCGR_PEP_ID=MMETSP1074-20121228/131935_1 /TAXON_ID=2916 /ORGANISM="Ceratium fusus, Strain PA161109" /LENGTH=37 /DNA_ID= /DNA_START= /DNA_END= /DNA_ORIENTATION=
MLAPKCAFAGGVSTGGGSVGREAAGEAMTDTMALASS